MEPVRTIAAVAGDPGGAAALAPVLRALAGRPGYALKPLAYRQALEAWPAHGIAAAPLAEDLGPADALAHLAGVDLLLTATSFNNGAEVEKRLLHAARLAGVPSVAVLDFWGRYRARFADEHGRLAYLPDRIAVPDARAREEMVEAGFAPERLVATGQPAFDELAPLRAGWTPERRDAVRARLGVGAAERMVLFLSQPIRAVFGDRAAPLSPGYTEDEVLASLAAALERGARARGERVALVVRPHPRERRDDIVLPRTGDAVRVRVSDEGDGREAALAADLVAGMTTVLLVEACLLGCVVLSLQPGLRGRDPLPTNRDGRSLTVHRADGTDAAVRDALWDPAVQAELRARNVCEPPGGAAERVIELVQTLLRAEQAGLVRGGV
jgi:hypothetical protein